MSEIFRARAPLRIGLAGGGTDIGAYSDRFGGAVLNVTISMYAHASIELLDTNQIVLEAIDLKQRFQAELVDTLEVDSTLPLHKACYNKLVNLCGSMGKGFKLSTYVDAPPGSGLGSSSTLVVAIISAFSEWLKLPFGEYDIASLAYEIERIDLGMAGGKQDQYAATFGGFNFIEFNKNGSALVNSLRIKEDYLREFEHSTVLYYTSLSRYSSDIIAEQAESINRSEERAAERLDAMHLMKEHAYRLKEAFLRGEVGQIGHALREGWESKKKTASSISTAHIDEVISAALAAGSLGGKISGAGGGGFAFFYCPGLTRYPVIKALQKFGGEFRRFGVVNEGVTTWRANG